MPIDFSQGFEETQIDLEVDLADQGGLQRFRTVADLNQWLQDENNFWQWFRNGPPADLARRSLGNVYVNFFTPIDNALQQINSLRTSFIQLKQHFDAAASNQNEAGRQQQQSGAQLEYEEACKSANNQIRSLLVNSITNQKVHLFRGTVKAAFVSQVSDTDPAVACFILGQFLQDEVGGDTNAYETKGRTLALLFSKGWLPRKEAEKLAYSSAFTTWKTELGHFKNDYSEQLTHFENVKENISQALSTWEATAQDLQEKFNNQFKANQNDLKNLKETYEGFMHLNAPMEYWREKRKEHDKSITKWAWLSGIGAIIGIALLLTGGVHLLPDVTPNNIIPWKKLGAFVMFATIIIWLMRFPFKMLLSNIHLRADAKEREVMISTYMALLRGSEGHQGISKENLDMVLTPIFRPATSGIIKDDSGPVSLFEMITRIK
jgi:hypothetical protein